MNEAGKNPYPGAVCISVDKIIHCFKKLEINRGGSLLNI